jgi:hypothetical protein
MQPLITYPPDIEDFKFYKIEASFFDFEKRIPILLNKATHFCYVEDFIHPNELDKYINKKGLYYSNWFAFKTFDNIILYRKLPLTPALTHVLNEFKTFNDFVFKGEKYYLSPLFF